MNLLIRCAYQAQKAMTFWADVDLFNDPAITLLFYIVSVYTVRTLPLIFERKFVTVLPQKSFSLGVIGATDLSWEFLLETWENSAFGTSAPDGRGFEAFVLDSGIRDKRAPVLIDVPSTSTDAGTSTSTPTAGCRWTGRS